MSTPVLITKLYVPPTRPKVITRPRLVDRLNEGLHHKLTLISAPAGFGKSTLVSEWVAEVGRPIAWLSLDDGDNDLARFLTYLIAAVQTVASDIGRGVSSVLQSPQPPPIESLLTTLLNEISILPDDIVLVLDDYHVIDAEPVNLALTFLIEHLPPRMHLIITTREDPQLPLARLRARGDMTELRVADLRFTTNEAATFLNEAMGLNLSAHNVATLERRTEGWIAGLQLAALSMQGHEDATGFIQAFTGSHHFVMDYLVEEVLRQQPERIQSFLLCTSILDQLCGPLCDAVVLDPSASSQKTLEFLERANLFLIPLDDERRWYRYHHLFAELLQQRLHQEIASGLREEVADGIGLHHRASVWYEEHGLEIEAFQHAAAARDVARAERLIEGKGVPLYFRGIVAPVLKWLESLPRAVLDARPSLWVIYASGVLFVDHTAVEQKLQSAEIALHGIEPDDRIRDLIGRIASLRATLAVIQNDGDVIIAQARRALQYLHPDNLLVRTAAAWSLGYAHQLRGDRAAASQAFMDVITTGKSLGASAYTMAATINLGQVQETDNQLQLAARTYRRVVELAGDPPQPMACEAFLGLARIAYQWNDLDSAHRYGQECFQLTQQMAVESVDTVASYDVFLARVRLAQGDVPGAVAVLAEAEAFVRQHGFVHRMPAVVSLQVLTLLRQGHLAVAAQLAQTHDLPLSQARVHLAQGNPTVALAVLEPLRRRAEARSWQDERLQVMVLQALAHQAHGDLDTAMHVLSDALALAELGSVIRLFVDEGEPMARLLAAADHGFLSGYTGRLLAAFHAEVPSRGREPSPSAAALGQSLVEPLSQRELEVLQLIAQGSSNHEIAERLFLALSTVKGHNRVIFGKLGVQRRTEAVARARDLGLL